ncbi:MAG: hypothetical protein IPK53_17455 [bacterium]|nr:hypothetical protein [bacterium]
MLPSYRLRLIVLLCVSGILFSMSSFAASSGTGQNAQLLPATPANFWDYSGPQDVQPIPFEVIDPDPSSVHVRLFDPILQYEPVQLGDRTFTAVKVGGEGTTTKQGEPSIPWATRLIMVSRTGGVAATVTTSSYTTIENIDVAPKQPYEGEELAQRLDGLGYAIQSDLYAEDAWYPQEIATITTPATLRDVRFVSLAMSPVQYNPARRELRVYDNIEVVIENVGGIGENEIVVNPEFISPSFKKLYERFENFAGSALDALPVLPGKYLVICPNNATNTPEAQRLVDWHRRKGLDASYVTLTTTGSTALAVRNYISSQYTASNGALEYVCMFGDPGASATFATPSGDGGTGYDNYLGVLSPSGGDNPDPVPDIAVGRLPSESATTLASLVTKTINYEANPYLTDTGWFTRTHCTAHTQFIQSNPSTKEYTRQIMLQDDQSCGPVQVFSGGIGSTEINPILNARYSVFNHRMSWIGELDPSGLASAPAVGGSDTEGGPLPFVYAMTCGTGSFNSAGQTLSEEWTIPPTQTPSSPRGAIGCVGLWGSGTHVPYNNIVDAGAMYGIYALGIHEMGIINIAGKLELYKNYQSFEPGQVTSFCYWSNLMGDPGTAIWTRGPKGTVVARPATINRGTNNVELTVTDQTTTPVENALVCLLKGSETFVRGYTDANGYINLPVATPTTGMLLVTVTNETQFPYRDSISVQNAAANLAFNTLGIDDDGAGGTIGNNDDVLSPGETIDLSINVTNTGTSTTVTGISGTLTSSSAGVTVVNAVQTYANIAVGGNANPSSPYRITVTSVFNGEPVTFFLNLTTNQGLFPVRIDLTPTAPDLDVNDSTFTFGGPGGNLNPGESGTFTPTIINTGARPMVGADGILRSLDPRVMVSDSVGIFGNVNSGANGTSAANTFAIDVSSAMFNGHRAPMQLVVWDDNGFRDSSDFELKVGSFSSTSPSGPDAYGYYAFDNTETQPSNAPSIYSWVEIAPSQGGPGTSLNMTDIAEDDDDTQTRVLPFNFTFYGQSFDTITICSNGWVAFGNYPTIDDFRNYRMGTPIGPPNQVAAYWDDLKVSGASENVYVYHNAVEHYYVIEWRARQLWDNNQEFFQVILYDPDFYPSVSGDGKVKVQYQTITLSANQTTNDNDYASVGIQNQDHSIGLDYYYWNAYGPGAATVAAGRSIMYTTDANGQLNPSLTLAGPNGGESFYLGQPLNVLWSSAAIAGNVNIQLNRSYPGGAWENIFLNSANDGVQSWTTAGAASTASRFRVISVLNPTVGDTSDANFSLLVPTVTVVEPNGGEVWAPGSLQEISWTSQGLGVARVELNRSYPGGAWELLSASAADVLGWTVTGPVTASARVRVSGVAYAGATDVSDANFTIGSPPAITHKQKSDQAPGAATFIALMSDDAPLTNTFRAYFRIVGNALYDSATFSPTGNPSEFSATAPGLLAGHYEYYLRTVDTEGLSDRLPDAGHLLFQVGDICVPWLQYDDGTAENYNWADGPDFEWAVRFDPGSYPYSLCAAQFAISPTQPTEYKAPVIVTVYLADGPSGTPGTVVVRDTTGAINGIGGLPTGPAWTDAKFDNVSISGPFYVSVENVEPRDCPAAFGLDTSSPNGNSYYYDACDLAWYAESSGLPNARSGDRMIRVSGFNYQAPIITIQPSGLDVILRWASTGAPYYKVYSSTATGGPFNTFIGSTSGLSYTHTGVVGTTPQNYYIVVSSATP